jgi:hypothetical protein
MGLQARVSLAMRHVKEKDETGFVEKLRRFIRDQTNCHFIIGDTRWKVRDWA